VATTRIDWTDLTPGMLVYTGNPRATQPRVFKSLVEVGGGLSVRFEDGPNHFTTGKRSAVVLQRKGDGPLLLTLDLVPSSCFFSNLRSELPKKVWDRLRREQYKKAGYRCEVCGEKGTKHPVECHELWRYLVGPKANLQLLTGLIALCPACHEVKHFGLAQAAGREERAMAQFCRVNGLDAETAIQYIRAQFDTWSERSAKTWDLDISWLDSHGVGGDQIAEATAARRKESLQAESDYLPAALQAHGAEHGKTPDGQVRVAVPHSACGHITVMQAPDPAGPLEDRTAFHEALRALSVGVCRQCAGLAKVPPRSQPEPAQGASEPVKTKPRHRVSRSRKPTPTGETWMDDDGTVYELS